MTSHRKAGPSRQAADYLITAIAREAFDAANLVCDFLERLSAGAGVKDHVAPLSLTVPEALDIAAVLRIQNWEACGWHDQLTAALPTSEEALDIALRDRSPEAARAATNRTAAPLAWTCFITWLERFAWNGKADLGCDVLIGNGSDASDSELRALAGFLWEHRRLISDETIQTSGP